MALAPIAADAPQNGVVLISKTDVVFDNVEW
jgi:hypothetical protein